MTRTDARMIAEELYKLMKKDIKSLVSEAVKMESDEYLNTSEVSKLMGVSISYVKQNISSIPHTKVGRLNKFRKSEIIKMLNR